MVFDFVAAIEDDWHMETANDHDRQSDTPQTVTAAAPRTIMLVAAGALIAVMVLAFVAYQRPELLLDFANVRYCN